MFGQLSNSWALVKASAAVLKADKELIVFPIISSIGVLIVSASFFLPLFLAGAFDQTVAGGGFNVLSFVVLFAFYIVQYFVIFFANTALVGAALIRLRGGDPTVGDGFRIASSRFLPLLGYALIAATVGMILNSLSRRSGFLGKLVISLVGFVWNVATFLVVPVLATEDVGPIEAIKRSSGLLKRTWGEQIMGNYGLNAVFGLATLALFVTCGGVALLALQMEFNIIAILMGVLLLVGLLALGLLNAALSGIYTAAVYQYAAEGQAGKFFDAEMVRNAFRPNNHTF